jgi:hypothetical protein
MRETPSRSVPHEEFLGILDDQPPSNPCQAGGLFQHAPMLPYAVQVLHRASKLPCVCLVVLVPGVGKASLSLTS